MKITIAVRPNAKKENVETLTDGTIRVSVNAPPHEGKANEAVIRAIATHFKVRKSAVRIVGGLKSKRKIIEISE